MSLAEKNHRGLQIVEEAGQESVFENAIILRSTNMSIGSITTNVEAVLQAVKEKSQQYQDVTKYAGDEKQAKEDRALLRKQKDSTKTTIASIQEAYNKPLEQFMGAAKQVLKQFDLAIDAIDEWVKESEAKEKEKKRVHIREYFDDKEFDLVPFDRIFNSKWLNKTYEMKDIKKEIDEAIASIYGNIKILENIAEHGMAAKAFYLDTLDMGAAMRKVELMKVNAAKLAREKIEREEREHRAQIDRNAKEERQEERQNVNDDNAQSLAAQALGIEEEVQVTAPVYCTYTLRIKGTKEQLKKLREYMTANNISYEKIEE